MSKVNIRAGSPAIVHELIRRFGYVVLAFIENGSRPTLTDTTRVGNAFAIIVPQHEFRLQRPASLSEWQRQYDAICEFYGPQGQRDGLPNCEYWTAVMIPTTISELARDAG